MAIPDETIDGQPLLSKNKIIVLAGLLALLLLGSGYALYSYSSNSTLRQYQTLTAEMSMEKMREMPAEERKEYFENMKNLREKMTEPQKEKADDSMRERFQTQMSEKMNKFFALPPEERKVELDKEVDRMASMMKSFGGGKGGAPNAGAAVKAPDGAYGRGQGGAPNAGGANANGNGQGGGGAGGSNAGNGNVAGGANAQGRGQGGADGAGKGGAATPGNVTPPGGGSPWGKGNPNATPEEKNKRTSDRLDNSTPEFRAQMTEYWKLVGERAKEKGVQIPNFGGPPTTTKTK